MMRHKNYLIIIILITTSQLAFAQVGINTTVPQGALDVNSVTSDPTEKIGFVYPVVSLTDITVQEINNPNPASGNVIVAGTAVYNTNTNSPVNVANSVYPGIYVWDGGTPGRWVPQFSKNDQFLFEQIDLPTNTRPSSLLGDESILFDVSSNYPFSPKYNGRYMIKLTVHYGGGAIDVPPSGQFVNFGAVDGVFSFTFNGGTPATFNARTFSGYNTDSLFNSPSSANSIFSNDYVQTFYVIEEVLDSSATYTFSLTFNQANAPGFQQDGNLVGVSDGRGYITVSNDIKCTLEFTYIGE